MTRSILSSTNRAQVTQPSVYAAEFLQLAFPSGTIYVTTADRNITWGGNTYIAQPTLMDSFRIVEANDLKSRRISMKLSGVDASLVNKIATDNYHFATISSLLGFFDATWTLLDTPVYICDQMLMSSAMLTLDNSAGVIELSGENWDIYNGKDSAVLVTAETQNLRYPGDTGLGRVTKIVSQIVAWGGDLQTA